MKGAPADCHPDRPNYGRGLCERCHRKQFLANHPGYMAKWLREHYDPEKSRDAKLRRQFGITSEQYNAMLSNQHGKCAVCGTTEPGGRWGTFCVDHNHATGEVRGLVCLLCNRAIGLLKDDAELALRLAEYLQAKTWRKSGYHESKEVS